MTVFILIMLHVVLLGVALFQRPRSGRYRVCALSLPVALGFCYLACVQGRSSALRLPADFAYETVANGLLVSFVAFAAFMLAYTLSANHKAKVMISPATTDFRRLGLFAYILSIIGLFGLFRFIGLVGGLSSYAGVADWTASPYESSGYLLNLRMALFPAIALFLILLAFRKASRLQTWLCLLLIAILLGDGINATDRGDTIRGAILLAAWLFLGANGAFGLGLTLGARMGVAFVPLVVSIAVAMMLPSFRGQGRKLLTSETTWEGAMSNLVSTKGDFRGAERGGEFDSGARIYDWIQQGHMSQTGPVHFLRVAWNVLPRAWVPEKHEMFERFAGESYRSLRFEATSYFGCAPSGWGEAYGTMGWAGVLGYFGLLGVGVRWLENKVTSLSFSILLAALAFVPLLQLVVMDFWSGAMNFSLTTLPMLVVLRLCQRRNPGAARKPCAASTKQLRRRALEPQGR